MRQMPPPSPHTSYASLFGLVDFCPWPRRDPNGYDPIKNTAHAFYVEFFGSAFLGFSIFALTNPKNPIPGAMVPLIIAASYGAMVASLGALTGYVHF